MELKGGSSTVRRASGDWSSSSGTLSSTCTPSGSPSYSDSGRGFHLPSIFSMLELDVEERAKKLRHMKLLVEEFSSGNVSERWLSELDVGWLLHLPDGDASARRLFISRQLQHLVRNWITALRQVEESVFAYFDGQAREDDIFSASLQPDVTGFAGFVEATLLKMLPFVDAVVALKIIHPGSGERATDGVEAVEKLQALIDVRDALSTASEELQFCPHSSLGHVETTRIIDEMSDLLSSNLGKLDTVIWDTTDEIRTGIMALAEDNGPRGSPGIHRVTQFVISYIKLLDSKHVLMSRIAYEAAQRRTYVPDIQSIGPLDSLIMEAFSGLEDKLVSLSQSLPCDSLGFLFLINNSYFVWQQLHQMFGMEFPMAILNRKIDDYIQSYLQASWGPVVSCLYYDPRPLRLGRYSPLPLFESEFQKIYNAQRLWKVPDPELRTRLRNAIIKKLTSGFRKFLDEYKSVTTPRITPQKLEEMLQDLFEG
ncbi:hypothetical protein EJB05_05671, partial [Eragrostis curvula]